MNWLSILLGGLPSLIPAIKGMAEVFVGNRQERDKNQHDENIATRDAYAKEWSYAAQRRTWWDALWDGINRMPRPLMALGIPAMFAWAAIDPASFERTMAALDKVPAWLWQGMGLILTFYFGARAFEKHKTPTQLLRREGPASGAASSPDSWRQQALGRDGQ